MKRKILVDLKDLENISTENYYKAFRHYYLLKKNFYKNNFSDDEILGDIVYHYTEGCDGCKTRTGAYYRLSNGNMIVSSDFIEKGRKVNKAIININNISLILNAMGIEREFVDWHANFSDKDCRKFPRYRDAYQELKKRQNIAFSNILKKAMG